MAVRRAGEKQRRILGIQAGQRLGDGVSERVRLDAIPHIEQKTPARLEHPARLAIARHPVGKEHRAELADDGIEPVIVERQIERVGLLPDDAPVGACLAAAWSSIG